MYIYKESITVPRNKKKENFRLTVTLTLKFDPSLTYGQVRARMKDIRRHDFNNALRELLTYEDTIKWELEHYHLQKTVDYT